MERVSTAGSEAPPPSLPTGGGGGRRLALVEELLVRARTLNDRFHPTSSAAHPSEPALSRKSSILAQGQLADALDHLLAVYLGLMVGSAEDRVMKPELENLRTYFRRTARTSQEQEGRHTVIGSSSRRFIAHGTGASRGRTTDNDGSTQEEEERSQGREPDDAAETSAQLGGAHKKARLASHLVEQKIANASLTLSPALPQIRQVVKTCHPSTQDDRYAEEDEGSDDDEELEVYD